MKLALLGNCQVGSVADSIELLVPGTTVQRKFVSNNPSKLGAELRKCSKSKFDRVMIHDSVQNIISANSELEGILPQETIVIPTVAFAAFQPDIQYVFADGEVVKNGLKSDWNSRILVWSYANKLTKAEARKLFREDVYEALGYFDEWSVSEETLSQSFTRYDFDFRRWMRAVQRSGVFMYGINHPVGISLTSLATQIVEREFSPKAKQVEDIHLLVTDYLSRIMWPVYPEIADELGIDGSLRWRVGRKYAHLDEFIDLCYQSWNAVGLDESNAQLIPLLSERDNVELLRLSGRG